MMTSWDDGRREDLKIVQLLKKYELPGIFFLPNNGDLTEDEIRELGKDFEIGGHTVNHPNDMKVLDDSQIHSEVSGNKMWLEGILGYEIDWFCYPRGRYDERVIDALKVHGFKYARTTIVNKLSTFKDPYRIDTAIHAYQRSEYDGVDWVEHGKRLLQKAKDNNGIFHLWGHSWEIDKNDQWSKIEELFKVMNSYLESNESFVDKSGISSTVL